MTAEPIPMPGLEPERSASAVRAALAPHRRAEFDAVCKAVLDRRRADDPVDMAALIDDLDTVRRRYEVLLLAVQSAHRHEVDETVRRLRSGEQVPVVSLDRVRAQPKG